MYAQMGIMFLLNFITLGSVSIRDGQRELSERYC